MIQIDYKKIFTKLLSSTILFLCFFYVGLIIHSTDISPSDKNTPFIETYKMLEMPIIKPNKSIELSWSVPDMQRMKTQGCVADGLLSGYNKPKFDIEVAKKSNCY